MNSPAPGGRTGRGRRGPVVGGRPPSRRPARLLPQDPGRQAAYVPQDAGEVALVGEAVRPGDRNELAAVTRCTELTIKSS